MKDDWSESSHRIVSAISWLWRTRPIGIDASMLSAEGGVVQPAFGHLGQHHARSQRVHADALGRDFAGEALGEGIDGALAGGIGLTSRAVRPPSRPSTRR